MGALNGPRGLPVMTSAGTRIRDLDPVLNDPIGNRGMAVKHAERVGGASPAAAVGEAMSKAARQRQPTP